MLLGQQGGGHQHRHLPVALGGDEGGAHGHLGLAETHVAADHPVHGLARLHIGEYRFDGLKLIRGLFEIEGGREGLVLRVRSRKGNPLAGGAAGVDLQQLGGHVADLFGRLALGLLPLVAAQAVQGGVLR